MILITILLFSIPPRGAPPELWQKYKSSIDLTKQTFKCFDGSKTISLSQFNDNYPDCKDSSDEPGTSIDSGTKFYCKNEGWEPQYITKWKVDDGICDCCDCSDESNETASQNKNTCASLSARKKKLVEHFEKIFHEGYEIYKNYSVEGEENYKQKVYQKAKLDSKVSILEEMRQRVIDKKPYNDLKDPDDFIPYEDFIPPPKNLEDDYYQGEENNDYGDVADEDDEYRYERYYDYYRYHQYYNPEEFYRNDYSYEYIPPQDEPPVTETPEPTSDYIPTFQNFDPTEETPNEEEEKKPESKFRQFFRKVWEKTFLYPDQKYIFQSGSQDNNNNQNNDQNSYNNYDYGYHPYDPETQAKLDAIDEKLNPARSDLYSFQLTNIDASMDKAYFQLYQKSFTHGEYTLTFFDDFKIDYEYLGSFKTLNETTNTMHFSDGSYCQSSSGSKSTTVHLYCWNEDKLVRAIRHGECSYDAYFVTPAACNDAIDRLHKMSLDELEDFNDMMNTNI